MAVAGGPRQEMCSNSPVAGGERVGWELYRADELRARCGPDLGTGHADGLKALLAENGRGTAGRWTPG
jgi:hypothetical protein